MANKNFIDISMHLENDVISDPPGYRPKIDYLNHNDSAEDVVKFSPVSRRRIYLKGKVGL